MGLPPRTPPKVGTYRRRARPSPRFPPRKAAGRPCTRRGEPRTPLHRRPPKCRRRGPRAPGWTAANPQDLRLAGEGGRFTPSPSAQAADGDGMNRQAGKCACTHMQAVPCDVQTDRWESTRCDCLYPLDPPFWSYCAARHSVTVSGLLVLALSPLRPILALRPVLAQCRIRTGRSTRQSPPGNGIAPGRAPGSRTPDGYRSGRFLRCTWS